MSSAFLYKAAHPPHHETSNNQNADPPRGGRTDQSGALVVLRVDGTAAGQDEEALLRAHDLDHAHAGQGLALDGSVDVGVQLPPQQAPGYHLLQGSLGEQWTIRRVGWGC